MSFLILGHSRINCNSWFSIGNDKATLSIWMNKKSHMLTPIREFICLYRVCNYTHRIFVLEAMKNYRKSSVPDYVIVLLVLLVLLILKYNLLHIFQFMNYSWWDREALCVLIFVEKNVFHFESTFLAKLSSMLANTCLSDAGSIIPLMAQCRLEYLDMVVTPVFPSSSIVETLWRYSKSAGCS